MGDLEVPKLAVQQGYDIIRVLGLRGKGKMSLAGVRLGEPPR